MDAQGKMNQILHAYEHDPKFGYQATPVVAETPRFGPLGNSTFLFPPPVETKSTADLEAEVKHLRNQLKFAQHQLDVSQKKEEVFNRFYADMLKSAAGCQYIESLYGTVGGDSGLKLSGAASAAEAPKGTEEDKSPNEENASRGEDELQDIVGAVTQNLQKVSTNEKPASEGTLLTPEFDKIMLELKKYSTFRGAYNDEEKRTIASHATGVQPRANVGCKFRCKCENADFVPYRDFINCASSKNNLHKCHARDLPDELIRELIKSDTNQYKCPFKLCKDSDEMSNSELRDHLKHKAHPLKGDRNGDEEVAAEYGDLIRKMRAEKIKPQ